MLGAVYIIFTSFYEDQKELPIATVATELTPSIPIERGVFARSAAAIAYRQMQESERSLNNYYDNRAYPGAPPTIPHPLISEKGIGGKTCLQCHQNGGYADQFKAFSPITPHPEWTNCKQCHVPKKTSTVFKSSNWEKMEAGAISQIAMPGAPPMIPHTLELRNNCLSCHASPAAPKEIRVSHPERVNCRQCHLPINTNEIFTKPAHKTTDFTRPQKPIGQLGKTFDLSEVKQISEWVNQQNR